MLNKPKPLPSQSNNISVNEDVIEAPIQDINNDIQIIEQKEVKKIVKLETLDDKPSKISKDSIFYTRSKERELKKRRTSTKIEKISKNISKNIKKKR